MTGKIVSVVNRKGGVGKTTLTLAIADTLVGESERPYDPSQPLVIAVDFDPQGSLTRALLYDRYQPAENTRLKRVLDEKRTVAWALEDHLHRRGRPVDEYVTHGVGPNGFTYALLANDARAWNVERRALKSPGELKLKSAIGSVLKELAETYRYVLVDSPPGQTVLAEASIQASDLVLCPTTPDLLSYWGLASFDEYLQDICDGERQPPARFVFTKFKPKPPKYDPQDQVYELVSNFKHPDNYVTLLREVGAESAVGSGAITLPFDPRLVSRLEGAPKPGRRWPWERMYTRDTQSELKRLVSAVKGELGNGESHITPASNRTVDRSVSHAEGSDSQVAR